ncbi:TPA: substrate-binding domain-containing protein [Escherichia coli]|nr:substrate-binding domain-containing protein [Escherichia coli]
MQNAGSLVVLGSINADHILNLQSFPTPGETVTGNHYQVAFGGKGANQAVAAGRSGANIAFIACTGDDSIGESVRQQLATDNIDISPVSVIKGESTGVALIFVNGEGENVIGIHAGANAALSPALVEAQRAGLNIPDGYEVTGDFEFNGGFDAMRQLLSHPLRPQAVFTGNDAMAVGVYQALYQAELQVPQDIAVIGYDDIELASFMTPPLTTIHQPKDELGELAIDVLIHRITQPTLQQQRLQLTPILMERGSA